MKLLVIVCGLLFCSLVPVCSQTFTITIWVDKGCGGEYFVGDMLTVNWEASHACQITFWELEPDGKRRKLNTQPVISSGGRGSKGWTLKDYGYGRRAIIAEASSLWGAGTAECEYYVLKKAADVQVVVKDQDGEPIAGVNVSLDNTPGSTTDAAGTCILSEVDFGEHTIAVMVGDEEQTSRIRIASTQKQVLNFVFTVEKRGTIEVHVFDQQGNFIQDADVYIDGFKEGRTAQDGTFTTSASEGSHFVEATWQNEKASQSVTVVRNQISSVDLTVYIAVETALEVTVQDAGGNAVRDASVYLDNIFLGRTDTAGKVKEKATPGARVVRVEKQGFQSVTQNVILQEGENTVTVVVTEEDAGIASILVLLGFLLLLKRR